jgi:hypothetical protein
MSRAARYAPPFSLATSSRQAFLLAAPDLDAILVYQLSVLVLGKILSDPSNQGGAFLFLHGSLQVGAALRWSVVAI